MHTSRDHVRTSHKYPEDHYKENVYPTIPSILKCLFSSMEP